MPKSEFGTVRRRKRLSVLNGLRAAAFFSTLLLFFLLVIGGYLLGNAVAMSIPYLIAAAALSSYLAKDFWGISPRDALFASDSEIRDKRRRP